MTNLGLGTTILALLLIAAVPFLAFVALVYLILGRDHRDRLRTDAAVWAEFSDRDPRTTALSDELGRVARERGAECRRRGEDGLVEARLTHPRKRAPRLRKVA